MGNIETVLSSSIAAVFFAAFVVAEKQNKKGMKRIFRYTEQLTKKKVTSYISLEGAEA
jgi:hypothetical protein